MCTTFNDVTLIQNKNIVCTNNCFQAMCNHNDRSALDQSTDCLLNLRFILRSKRCCCFIIALGNGDSLFFTAGQRRAAFTDHGIESLRRFHDKVIVICQFRSLFDFLPSLTL